MEELYRSLMKGKKKPEDDQEDKNAMLSVLKDIHKMASDDLGHDIHGVKKVSVASNDDEGLAAGLDKAKDMLRQKNMMHSAHINDEDADESSADMHPESRRHKLMKHDEMSGEADGMANPHGDADDEVGMAYGGEVTDNQDEEEHMADVVGAEHQRLQSRGVDSKASMPTVKKEKDTSAPPAGSKAYMADGGMVKGTKGQGTHGTHASPDPADEYADLDPEEIEALIAHLQRFRKSSPTF